MSRLQMKSFALLVILAPSLALAQDRGLRERTVPMELVEGLLATRPGQTAPIVVVGEIPEPMKTRVFVPPNARVLGGIASSGSATVILAVGGDPAALRTAFERDAASRGMKELDSRNGTMGGFRDLSRTGPLVYCDGPVMRTITFGPGSIGESRVSIVESSEGYCSMQSQPINRPTPNPMDNLRWPVLVNPENARGTGECGFSRRPSFVPPAELSTRATPDSILAHYGKQLDELGYAPVSNLSTRSWVRTDPAGPKMLMELSVQAVEGSPCRRVFMRTSAWR